MRSILIVEDDITFGMMLKTWLGKKGFNVSSVSNIARAQKHIDAQPVDLILSDLRLPDHDGIHLLKWMGEKELHIPLIIMTGYADIQSAVQAMKLGAQDYIAKPVNPEELLKKMSKALQKKEAPLPKTPLTEKSPKTKQESHSYLEGESDAAKQLYNYVSLVAPTNMSVLINGASGTGKEYVAHRIHQLSKRSDKPFIAIDCGSIPKELAASEFFGHIKGSFTGALSDKTGAFVAADGGTIFLDEIGNLSYEIQIQLLRALQERKIRPVGSNSEITVDIRLVSATNENLQQAIEKGTFREDLYHRLSVIVIRVPPLRERREDIPLLVAHFMDKVARENDMPAKKFTTEALNYLSGYEWPGNIRQLENVVESCMVLVPGTVIDVDNLPAEIRDEDSQFKSAVDLLPVQLDLADTLEKIEAALIRRALVRADLVQVKAAELLGISKSLLQYKLKKYAITGH